MSQLAEKQIAWDKLAPQQQIDYLYNAREEDRRLINLLIKELTVKGIELSFELKEAINNF